MSKAIQHQDSFEKVIEMNLQSHLLGLLCRLVARKEWKRFSNIEYVRQFTRVEYEILTVLSDVRLSHFQTDVEDMVGSDRAHFVEALNELTFSGGGLVELDRRGRYENPMLRLTDLVESCSGCSAVQLAERISKVAGKRNVPE